MLPPVLLPSFPAIAKKKNVDTKKIQCAAPAAHDYLPACECLSFGLVLHILHASAADYADIVLLSAGDTGASDCGGNDDCVYL